MIQQGFRAKLSGLLLWFIAVGPASGAARMISSGYMNCVSCHETALGKGVLTPYGNSVDSAQSLAKDQYKPAAGSLAMILRGPAQAINQDLRLKMQGEDDAKEFNRQKMSVFHRSVTSLDASGLRLDTQASFTQTAINKPNGEVETTDLALLERAMLEYRLKRGETQYELALGRDSLPSGVNVGNETSYLKSFNNMGPDRFQQQARLTAWNDKYLYSVYGYTPTSKDYTNNEERGGGGLFEYYLPSVTTVLGVSTQMSQNVVNDINRQSFGGYARIGFNKYFGMMHETVRSVFKSDNLKYTKQVTQYWDVHAHLQEWLVGQLVYEHLDQDLQGQPYRTTELQRIY